MESNIILYLSVGGNLLLSAVIAVLAVRGHSVCRHKNRVNFRLLRERVPLEDELSRIKMENTMLRSKFEHLTVTTGKSPKNGNETNESNLHKK
jgi:hypothetical protein